MAEGQAVLQKSVKKFSSIEESRYDLPGNNIRADVKICPYFLYADESSWHGSFLDVRRIFEKSGQKDVPRELLPYLYENTLCSCCRESVLMEMGRRRMVTNELLRECIYDSNEEIRRYAAKRLKLGKN